MKLMKITQMIAAEPNCREKGSNPLHDPLTDDNESRSQMDHLLNNHTIGENEL